MDVLVIVHRIVTLKDRKCVIVKAGKVTGSLI